MAKIVGTNGDDSGADALTGTDGKDKILGKGGDDEIYGLGGNDRLFGGVGDDSIFGGLGDDRIFGGSGDDVIEGNEGDDKIKGGSGDDTIDGGSGDDWLGGGSGNDFIEGGDGRDDISGGSGDDTIDGGADADWIFGGSGHDTIAGGDGADIIKGGSGNDIVDGGSGDDWIIGNSGDDTLEGGAGNDVLIGDSGWCSGASGDDYVDGGAGYDAVFAQAGNDVATYNMSENLGFWDYYDGGRGNDVLRLELTSAELASTAVQADIAAYRSFLATHSNPDTDHGKRFDFSAFGLSVRDFETLEIVTLNNGPTANDDANPADAVVEAGINADGTPNAGDPSATGNVLDNDTDPDALDVLTVTGVATGSTPGPVAGNVGGSGIVGTYGTLTLAADGTWSYALDNADADTNALAQGQTATDVFSYTISDLAGETSTATLSIDVAGTNDPAEISGVAQGTVIENADPISVPNDLDATDVDNTDDSFRVVANGAVPTANRYGTYAVNAAGEWTYTLDNGNAAVNALGASDRLSDSFTVFTEDGTAKTVHITIIGANDAPEAEDQTFTIGQNGALDRIALAQSDVDAGDQLSDVLAIIDPKPKSPPKDGSDALVFIDENESNTTFQPSGGSGLLTNHDDGTFSFDTDGDYEFLGEGESIDVDFTYTVRDQAGETATASVTITIEGENDAPVTLGSSWTIPEDFTFSTAGVTGFDPDDNDPVTFIVIDGPAHAAFFELDPVLGTFVYTPEADFNGADSFTFKANDGRIDSNISTVSFNVTPVNDAAVITGDVQGTVGEDAVPDTVSGDLDATDVDNDDDVFQAVAIGAATANGYGTYGVTASGVWTYTLDNGNAAVNALNALDTLSDSFTVFAEDGTAQIVDITITGANDAPVAVDQMFTIGQNGSLDRIALDQLDVDAGDHLTDVLTVENPNAKSSKQRFVDYEENEAGDTFQPQRFHGLLSNHDDGTFSFDTNGDFEFIGEGETFDVEFTYIVEDQAGETATATVTIAIEGENDAPTTRDTTRTIQEEHPGLIGGVVREDPDDNDVLTVILVEGPAHAAFFEFNAVHASFTYAPEADFNGTDSFTYKANDGRVDSNISTVTFNVTPVNDAAVITGLAQGTVVEDAVPNTVSGDLDAADVDNTDDVFQAVANGATTNGYGTYAVDAAGVWTYTLDNGNAAVDALNALDVLTDSFTVLSEDGTAQTVDITINGADDGPVAADDVGSATEAGGVANGTPGSNAADNVLDNDTSVSGSLEVAGIRTGNVEGSGTAGTLGVALAGQYGTLTMQADGSYIYVVNDTDPEVQALNVTGANTSLTDTFNYTTSDGSLTDTAVLAITINGANDAPTAQPLTLYVKTGESVDGVLVGGDVDGNDDAGSLIYQLVSAPDTGELTGGLVNGDFDSAFTFITPRRGQSDAVFTYKTVDSHGASSEHTTVTVIVNEPTAPTAVDDAFVTDEDSQLVGNVLEDNGNGADSDINGDALSVTAGTFATAQGGSVTFQANGDFTYDPLADFNGEDTFTYEVVDVDGSSTGTVTVTVNPIDDLLL